jgi:hypothetical protein
VDHASRGRRVELVKQFQVDEADVIRGEAVTAGSGDLFDQGLSAELGKVVAELFVGGETQSLRSGAVKKGTRRSIPFRRMPSEPDLSAPCYSHFGAAAMSCRV